MEVGGPVEGGVVRLASDVFLGCLRSVLSPSASGDSGSERENTVTFQQILYNEKIVFTAECWKINSQIGYFAFLVLTRFS